MSTVSHDELYQTTCKDGELIWHCIGPMSAVAFLPCFSYKHWSQTWQKHCLFFFFHFHWSWICYKLLGGGCTDTVNKSNVLLFTQIIKRGEMLTWYNSTCNGQNIIFQIHRIWETSKSLSRLLWRLFHSLEGEMTRYFNKTCQRKRKDSSLKWKYKVLKCAWTITLSKIPRRRVRFRRSKHPASVEKNPFDLRSTWRQAFLHDRNFLARGRCWEGVCFGHMEACDQALALMHTIQ